MKTNTQHIIDRLSPTPALLAEVARIVAHKHKREEQAARAKLEWDAAQAREASLREDLEVLDGTVVMHRNGARSRVERFEGKVKDAEQAQRNGKATRAAVDALKSDLARAREEVDAYDARIRATDKAIAAEVASIAEQAKTAHVLDAAKLSRITPAEVRKAYHDHHVSRFKAAQAESDRARGAYASARQGDVRSEIARLAVEHCGPIVAGDIEASLGALLPALGALASLSEIGGKPAAAGAVKHLGGARFEVDLSSYQLEGLPSGWLDNLINQASATLEKEAAE